MVLLLFVLGIFIGSFLNVLADRFENKESVLTGRSHCDYCKKVLSWRDLIPLFSFLSTSGKCRYCHHKLSFYYPVSEIFTGIFFALSYVQMVNGQWSMVSLVFGLYVISSMIVVFLSDIKYGIIPDKIIVPAAVISLIYLIIYFPSNVVVNLLAAVGSLLFFLFIFLGTRGKAMGFGDVKFAFLLGLILGPLNTIIALYVAFLTGAAAGLILILWKKKRLKTAVPFGPFLVLGFFVSYFFAPLITPIIQNFI